MHLELGLLLFKFKSYWDELAFKFVTAYTVTIAGYDNTCVTYTHFHPSTLSERVDAKQTLTMIQSDNSKEVREELWCGGRRIRPGSRQ